MEPLVTVTIDGRTVQVPKGTLVVEAARQAGIEIPVFCYHPKLKPVGACRMCFVQVEKMPGLVTACTTTVAEGMVVYTTTPPVVKAQNAVIEFLLLNHPLDCPVCDRGGECPLQDNTFKFGLAESRYIEPKRHFIKPVALSPYILLDRERCILCYRCVRFQREIAGDESLTVLDRGDHSEIGLAPGRTFDSPFSGNTIELCPVGALTSTLYRFRARPWDLKSVPSVCTQCGVGCNIRIDVRANTILRLLSRENTPVDDGWLCDRGRFTYRFVHDPARLTRPLRRVNGALQPVSWHEALETVAERIQAIVAAAGPQAVGGLAAPTATNEELYLFQKVLRAVVGTNNIDHTVRPHPPVAPLAYDAVTGSIVGLERARTLVLVDCATRSEQPVLHLRLRKAVANGAQLVLIQSAEPDLWTFPDEPPRRPLWLRPRPGTEAVVVAGLVHLILAQGRENREFVAQRTEGLEALRASAAAFTPERVEAETGVPAALLQRTVDLLLAAPTAAFLYRRDLQGLPSDRLLVAGLYDLALLTGNLGRPGTGLYPLVRHANSQGALDLGVHPRLLPGQRPVTERAGRAALEALWGTPVPAEPGLSGADMIEAALAGRLRALYLLGRDPLADHPDPERVRQALARLDLLIVQDILPSPAMEMAHLVLPGLSFAEKEGTLTSLERRIQRLRPAVVNQTEARSDWRILQDVANRLGGLFLYAGPDEVFAEIARAVPFYAGLTYEALGDKGLQWPATVQQDGAGVDLYADGERRWALLPLETEPKVVR